MNKKTLKERFLSISGDHLKRERERETERTIAGYVDGKKSITLLVQKGGIFVGVNSVFDKIGH